MIYKCVKIYNGGKVYTSVSSLNLAGWLSLLPGFDAYESCRSVGSWCCRWL